MKLARFDEDRLGVVIGNMVHDVTDVQTEIRKGARYDMKGDAVIAALPTWRGKLEEAAKKAPGKPVSSVKLISPIARPSKAMAAPTNYKKHIEEMRARTDIPREALNRPPNIEKAGIFLKSNTSLVGPSEGVPMRFPDRRNDHEAELVVIIGKQGSDIPKEKAWDYIAGYSLGLDMTARGQEDRSFRKSIDGYTVLGPWMITADEIPPGTVLTLVTRLNGTEMQRATTEMMIFKIPRLINYISTFTELVPGDVIVSGTPGGVGSRRTPPVWMNPGDKVEIEVDKVGVLVNPIGED